MDCGSVYDSSNSNSHTDVEVSRVKFLCSFGGSILPRPQDGRLRYVGGETRIVSVPRDIGFEELMGKMRELYEGAAILKYQQPDEDLDALVSVVNDDDVTNMMEEYDKLGSADGFTRLRIFLFSHIEQDASPHYMEGDDRDTERRYVDALNSLSESPDYRRLNDSPVMTPIDEVQIADQLYSSMNLDGSVHNQRNFDMGLPQYNLRQLAVPTLGSGGHSGSYVPRYTDEATWSPAHYSPRCAGPHEARPFAEYPSSPSSARYRMQVQDVPERFPVESCHLPTSSQIPFDQQQQYSDNVVWLPNGIPVDRSGFPGNILNGPCGLDGTGICGNCKMTYQRNPSSFDFHWKPEEQSHLEQPTAGNGFLQVPNACVNCLPNREAALLNMDSKLQHGIYREQGDPRTVYNETQTPDRGWLMQNQLRIDEQRSHMSGVGRMSEHYTLSGTGPNIPLGPSGLPDGNLMPTGYARHEEPRYTHPGAELGGDVFHDQSMVAGSHVHIPLEERVVWTSNSPYSYGAETPQRALYSNPSAQVPWRNAATQAHLPPLHDSFNLQPRNSRPDLYVGGDHSTWVDSPQRKLAVDGSAMPDYPYGHRPNLSPGTRIQDVNPISPQEPVRNLSNNAPPPPLESRRSSELPTDLYVECSSDTQGYSPLQRENTDNIEVKFDGNSTQCKARETTCLRESECSNADGMQHAKETDNAEKGSTVVSPCAINSSGMKPGEQASDMIKPGETNTSGRAENADLSFLPELIASANRAKLESVEVVKARAQEDGDTVVLQEKSTKDANAEETDSPDFDGHSEDGSENENNDASKIEVSKAEEEAIAKGLQTIKNADLEEIRELGAGTYGSVYHGKWKGSDVAIKRIKASCFAGRPSERERLIADFWKEALILSSLHHPNVVSFYGIVRDGPDGSLATVTEFMVNGSLKQYLRKKDRTIDRRKRLIIAMDAAFGMEYLHGKNIVHFDLKCENLLVNMRDPHRPVCKIGDLGLSKVKQNTLVSGGVRGTLPWMAPELLSGKSHMVTEKIDVYSFGIVMWELLTGEEPYKDMHCASIIGGIVNNTLRPQIPTWCDPEWKSLMESCWAYEPAERPSFAEISQKLRSMAAAMNVK